MADEPLWGTWFEPFTVPLSDPLKALIKQTINSLNVHRLLTHRRKRKPQDQASFLAAVDAILANLVLANCDTLGSGRIAINLSHREVVSRKRYLNPRLPVQTLSSTLYALEELGVLEVTIGGRGQSTTFRPSPMFTTELEAYDIGLKDITHDWKQEELLILSQRQRDNLVDGPRGELRAILIDYQDDVNTHKMRGEVRELLSYVARLDLSFEDEQLPRVDLNRRTFKRRFSVLPSATLSTPNVHQCTRQPSNWIHGGRLFGDAFWLSLRRDRRRNSLKINGEPTTEVDLQAFFLRASYVILGEKLPDNLEADPYAIQGYPEGASRGALKAAFASFLYHDGILKRLPNKIAEKMPEGWTAKVTREAILRSHPKIAPLFGTRVGFRLLRLESDILIATMAALAEAGLSGLPLHDGVICPVSEGLQVQDIMAREAEKIAGPGLVVELKGS